MLMRSVAIGFTARASASAQPGIRIRFYAEFNRGFIAPAVSSVTKREFFRVAARAVGINGIGIERSFERCILKTGFHR